MYTERNFKTKKALREAVANGEKIGVYQPGPFDTGPAVSKRVFVEGPHYPEPHKWYAEVWVDENGHITKVR